MNQEQTLTLEAMLAAKEARAARQQALLVQYGGSLASITVNLPGPYKNRPEAVALVEYAVQTLAELFGANYQDVQALATGPLGFVSCDAPAEVLKRAAVAIEETGRFGRLLDIDVFDKNGVLLSRGDTAEKKRQCFLCDRPAIVCMREGRHSPAELETAVQEMLEDFMRQNR